MTAPTDIQSAVTALEIRRLELEFLVAKDLERRFFSGEEEMPDVVTKPIDAVDLDHTDTDTARTRCGSHFAITWLEHT